MRARPLGDLVGAPGNRKQLLVEYADQRAQLLEAVAARGKRIALDPGDLKVAVAQGTDRMEALRLELHGDRCKTQIGMSHQQFVAAKYQRGRVGMHNSGDKGNEMRGCLQHGVSY